MKYLYHLKSTAYYYNYAIEGTCRLSLAFPRGIYVKAYSFKQATLYIKRQIAIHDMVRYNDIDIDNNDIELIEG